MVAPSPMNAVKLELAVICCVGVLLWLAQGRITANPMAQLLLMGGYGCVGMVWIVFRTRRVLTRVQSNQYNERRNYGQE